MYRHGVALFLGGDAWLEDAYNLRLYRFKGKLWHAFNMLMKYRGIKDSDAIFCASEWLSKRVSLRCREEKVFALYFIFPEHHWNDVEEEQVEYLKHPSAAAIMDFDVYPQLIGFRPLRKLSQRFNNINFFFAGDGRYLPLVKSWFQKCDNVTFLGHISHFKVKGLLRQVDFVIHPAAYEGGIGGGVCEALLMAKPVVAWNVGGLPEIITDGKSGFLCHILNDWERAFHVLLDEKTCRRFGQYGYRFIYDHFCERKTIRQLMKKLKTIS